MLDTILGCSQPNNLTSTKFLLVWFTRKARKVVFANVMYFLGMDSDPLWFSRGSMLWIWNVYLSNLDYAQSPLSNKTYDL